MNIKYVIILVLSICCLSCTYEDKTQPEKQAEDTKIFVKERKKVEDKDENGLTFYDKARARMKAKEEAERDRKWANMLATQKAFVDSNYTFRQGQISRVNDELAGSVEEKAIFDLIKKTYQQIQHQFHMPEGMKIIVTKTDKVYIVTFDKEMDKCRSGPSLIAKVTIDAASGNIIHILGS